MKHAAIPLALLVFALAALPANAEIYTWKDKDGKPHFADIPPTGINAQPVGKTFAPPPATEAGDAPAPAAEGEAATPASDIPKAAPAKTRAERDLEFRQQRAAAAEAQTKAEKDAAHAARRAQDCERAKNQRAALINGQRAARPTENGGRVFLTQEERTAEISRVQEMIDAFCGE
ncbi:MAG: DUF4124 domain-containing protein [Azoarcus sp.]|jgi:hypothetical protein|nr:DUF4124 domain-containing protein [Azoarcus sp.]